MSLYEGFLQSPVSEAATLNQSPHSICVDVTPSDRLCESAGRGSSPLAETYVEVDLSASGCRDLVNGTADGGQHMESIAMSKSIAIRTVKGT